MEKSTKLCRRMLASSCLFIFLTGCTQFFTQNIGKGISPGDQIIDIYPPAKEVPQGNVFYSKGIQTYHF